MNRSTEFSFEKAPLRVWATPLLVAGLAVGAATALQWSWRHQLPASIATHWSGRMPDGFMTLGQNITFTVAFGLGITVCLVVVGAVTGQLRPMGAVASGIAVGFATLSTLLVASQRGLASAATHQFGGRELFGCLAAGLLVGVAVWAVLRRRGPEPVATEPLVEGAPVIAGAPGQRLAWVHRVRTSRAMVVLAVAVECLFAAVAVGIARDGDWWSLAFIVLVALALPVPMGIGWAVVTIDRRGVRARAMGVRWVSIPLETITSAEVEPHVVPLGQYGGWGLRGGFDGSRGLVTAGGPALRIHRAEQSGWVITVDDAERAAAVVNTLAGQRLGA